MPPRVGEAGQVVSAEADLDSQPLGVKGNQNLIRQKERGN